MTCYTQPNFHLEDKASGMGKTHKAYLLKQQNEDHCALLQSFLWHLQMRCPHHMPLQDLP